MTGGRILAIDTSGTSALVALGEADGVLLAERRWPAGYRHGEELLTHVDEMLTAAATALGELGGIVVGTGPGAFTGLRVGLATAKALARGLNIPIAGVPSSEALLRAASLAGGFAETQAVLLLPAGPSDRVVVAGGQAPAGQAPAGQAPAGQAPAGEAPAGEAPAGEAPAGEAPAGEAPAGEAPAGEAPAGEAPAGEAPAGLARLVRGGEEPELEAGAILVAVDLPGRAPDEALALGLQAEAGFSAALLGLGAQKLAAGSDDVALLVPEYVSLPRGVPVLKGEVKWSHDHR